MENMDLLSALPMNIIHIILSFLPIGDAIITSLLSWKWRYIWASLPYLYFDDEYPPMKHELKRMDHFISQVLFLHEGPIHKFELNRLTGENSHCNDEWLIFLSRNGIRNLVLRCDGSRYLHSSLYSCQYLTNLQLFSCKIPPPPQSFKGFLWLKSLDLHIFEFCSTTIENIVARSPLLEELRFFSYGGWELKICAPNLKYFNFRTGRKSELSLCTPLLEEFTAIFRHMTHFSIGAESLQGSSSVFPHLRTANLYRVPFDVKEVTPAIVQLITSSPNLQKLKISGSSVWSDASELVCASLRDAESAPDITYDNLKVIEIFSFRGALNEMILIRFLLARTPVLEKMMYNTDSSVPAEELPNLMAELLSFRRASANAQILISGRLKRSF